MEALKQGEMRVHLRGGTSYIAPELGKANIVRCLGDSIARIEHYKPIETAGTPVKVVTAAPVAEPAKTKESLLGDLFKDNKITAGEMIEWIEKSKSVEDIGIVMKGETRKTVKAAAKEQISKLL